MLCYQFSFINQYHHIYCVLFGDLTNINYSFAMHVSSRTICYYFTFLHAISSGPPYGRSSRGSGVMRHVSSYTQPPSKLPRSLHLSAHQATAFSFITAQMIAAQSSSISLLLAPRAQSSLVATAWRPSLSCGSRREDPSHPTSSLI